MVASSMPQLERISPLYLCILDETLMPLVPSIWYTPLPTGEVTYPTWSKCVTYHELHNSREGNSENTTPALAINMNIRISLEHQNIIMCTIAMARTQPPSSCVITFMERYTHRCNSIRHIQCSAQGFKRAGCHLKRAL